MAHNNEKHDLLYLNKGLMYYVPRPFMEMKLQKQLIQDKHCYMKSSSKVDVCVGATSCPLSSRKHGRRSISGSLPGTDESFEERCRSCSALSCAVDSIETSHGLSCKFPFIPFTR